MGPSTSGHDSFPTAYGQISLALHSLQHDDAILFMVHLKRAPIPSGASTVGLVRSTLNLVDPDIFPRLQALEHEVLPALFRIKLSKFPFAATGLQPVVTSADSNRFESALQRVIVAVLNHHGVAQLELILLAEGRVLLAMVLTTSSTVMLSTSSLSVPQHFELAVVTATSGKEALVLIECQPFPGLWILQFHDVAMMVDSKYAVCTTMSSGIHRPIRGDAQIFAPFLALEHHLISSFQLSSPLSKLSLSTITVNVLVVVCFDAD